MPVFKPEIYYFLPSFRRHHVLINTVNIYKALADSKKIRIAVVIVDATDESFPRTQFPDSSEYFAVDYYHSPKILLYSAGFFLDGKLDTDVPVFFAADDELAFIERADLENFSQSASSIGIPHYLVVKQDHDDYVRAYTGWTQCRDLCFVDDPITRLKLFADQGVILHYVLYDGNYFRSLFKFISAILALLARMEDGVDRFNEVLFSLTTMAASNIYLKHSGYIRRVDRRPAQVAKHRKRFEQKPVYPWILIPRLRDAYPELFQGMVSIITDYWAEQTKSSITSEFVNQALDAYAVGYQQATSRTWREGYEFTFHKRSLHSQGGTGFDRIFSNYDADHVSYNLNRHLIMTEIEKIKFRNCWVSNHTLKTLFILKSSTLFDDEDAHLNSDTQ